jgi:ADP-ribosyl-[dinitrogen reductase] hydrolase
MAQITFFTKLGCLTAAKQIELLLQSGHEVDVRDLLAHCWTAEELTSYFGEIPVKEWFNDKSPRVKSGEIVPEIFERVEALALMLSDHLLIRRPLMESGGVKMCGFDPDLLHAWVGLGAAVYARGIAEDFSSCSQPLPSVQSCP